MERVVRHKQMPKGLWDMDDMCFQPPPLPGIPGEDEKHDTLRPCLKTK
jgi:hypothetical protein